MDLLFVQFVSVKCLLIISSKLWFFFSLLLLFSVWQHFIVKEKFPKYVDVKIFR